MAVTIVVANRKGGSGKTTTTVNLADGLARRGKKVLVVDADSQAQATVSIGILPHRLTMTLYELLHLAASPRGLGKEQINETVIRNQKLFDLIPSKPDLSAVEVELANQTGRESLLKDLLLDVMEDYQFILIDLPPSLGFVAVNGLVAADWLVIPTEPSFLSMDGLAQMMGILYRVNAELNPGLRLMGVLPVKCDLRTNLARSVLAEIKNNFGEEMLLPPIRNDIRLAEAPSFGKTIFEYSPASRGAQDYENLVETILSRSGEQ
ncbi:MAG TPA: ParA family protein [Syntrophothermus lipocalidus]|uniref:Sporulation initiation inhibitor protein Soj n=1 Tax=Syntrophothermus lipocalidus (strain DSM 12680 / TGB-C1) TaxID=643648 RepID=D7CP51_SYNLT|nr:MULTISPECIES: ParA family protein [Syntrophothermus]ADI02486.1 Cobyrinic acid ac-diamide synthase [Syntrophothermus lipocalidus DSM 12680]NSW83728.1 ParA family protein [Syntrophothermus sp.]HHV77291.1 ParA family protein [Syntrophothermus lipocalidus]HOV43845.1 ParA family protein [Syntrophothermus lipocalidus]